MKEFQADAVEGAVPALMNVGPNLSVESPFAPALRPADSQAGPSGGNLAELPAPRTRDNQRLRQFNAHFKQGRNPLIATAGPIVNLILVLNEGARHENPHVLRTIAAGEIRAFHTQIVQQSVSRQNVEIASYALCSALDEAVLTTDWGSESDWRTETLLWIFHTAATGGENFFTYLEELTVNPDRPLDLLELLSLLLDLGFQGHHRIAPDGAHVLESIRARLHEIIAANRSRAPSPLRPPEPETAGSTPRSQSGQMIVALLVALLVLIVYLNLIIRAQLLTDPLVNRVEHFVENYESVEN